MSIPLPLFFSELSKRLTLQLLRASKILGKLVPLPYWEASSFLSPVWMRMAVTNMFFFPFRYAFVVDLCCPSLVYHPLRSRLGTAKLCCCRIGKLIQARFLLPDPRQLLLSSPPLLRLRCPRARRAFQRAPDLCWTLPPLTVALIRAMPADLLVRKQTNSKFSVDRKWILYFRTALCKCTRAQARTCFLSVRMVSMTTSIPSFWESRRLCSGEVLRCGHPSRGWSRFASVPPIECLRWKS